MAYKITPAKVLTDLFSFANNGLGYGPYAGLLQATDGNFYGAAESNPGVSLGVIYQLAPSGTYSMLFNLTNTGGAYPARTPKSRYSSIRAAPSTETRKAAVPQVKACCSNWTWG